MTAIDAERLAQDLRALGLSPGDLLVHASMRRIGAVHGGPSTVLSALRAAAGGAATIVVPTQTTSNSLTSRAFLRATAGLEGADLGEYVSRMPGFDRRATPSEGMGTLAEYVRRRPDTVRSGHPQTSFAASGPGAEALMAVHDLDCHLGERSPLGALYTAGATVLLLGVGYESCTAIHLAEYRMKKPPAVRPYHCFVTERGRRVRYDFLAPDVDDRDFGELGADLEREPFVRAGRVGNADARLAPVRALVDFAIEWLNTHRTK